MDNENKIIPIVSIVLDKWMNKFRNTMDNRELVFDEESCKRESLLLAEELGGILEKYDLQMKKVNNNYYEFIENLSLKKENSDA